MIGTLSFCNPFYGYLLLKRAKRAVCTLLVRMLELLTGIVKIFFREEENMSLTAGIILGILIGWLVEWIIDWLYWRKRREALLPAQISKGTGSLEITDHPVEVDALLVENETLKKRLERYAAVGDGLVIENNQLKSQLEKCKNESSSMTFENTRLKSQLDDITRGPDDLKVIKGIGPEIERMLHKAGILSFAQLADLSPADLENILGSVVKRLANEQDLLDQARKLANK